MLRRKCRRCSLIKRSFVQPLPFSFLFLTRLIFALNPWELIVTTKKSYPATVFSKVKIFWRSLALTFLSLVHHSHDHPWLPRTPTVSSLFCTSLVYTIKWEEVIQLRTETLLDPTGRRRANAAWQSTRREERDISDRLIRRSGRWHGDRLGSTPLDNFQTLTYEGLQTFPHLPTNECCH